MSQGLEQPLSMDWYLFTKPEEPDGVGLSPQTAGPIHAAGPEVELEIKTRTEWRLSLSKFIFANNAMSRKYRKHDSLDGFPSDFSHDGTLSSQILVTQTQEVVDDKRCKVWQIQKVSFNVGNRLS